VVNAWKVILATVVIFGAGVFTGGMLVKITNKPEMRPAPMVFRLEMIRRLTRELDLAPGQRARIERSLSESAERVKILGSLIDPEMREEFKKVHEEIRDVLTPRQRRRFEELQRERQDEAGEPDAGRSPRAPAARPGLRSLSREPLSTSPSLSTESTGERLNPPEARLLPIPTLTLTL